MEHVEYTRTILGKGLLGGWQTLAVMLLVLVLAGLALRRDLRKVRRARLARILAGTKLALVLLVACVLYQPSLYVRKTITRPGNLVFLVDDSASMGVVDEPESVSELLDLVEITRGVPLGGRMQAAGEFCRLLDANRRAMQTASKRIDGFVKMLEQGLPRGAATSQEIARMATEFRKIAEGLRRAAGQLRGDMAGLDRYRIPREQQEILRLRAEQLALVGEKIRAIADQLVPLAGGDASSEQFAELRDSLRAADEDSEKTLEQARAVRESLDQAFLDTTDPATARLAREVRKLSRIEILCRVLEKSPNVAALRKAHRVTLMSLTRREPTDTAALAATEASTDFLEPLRKILNDYSRQTVSAIVLFSDGQQNSFAELDAVLRTLRAKGIPLDTVAVGSSRPITDFAIADYRLPVMALRYRRAYVTATVKTAAPKDTPFVVSLREGDKVLASGTFKADGARDCEIALPVAFDRAGHVPVTLAVAPARGADKFAANDQVTDSVPVLAEKLNALVVGDVPSWDVRYLLAAMVDLPVKAECVFTGASDKAPERGGTKGKVPQTPSHWKRYDLVVLAGQPFKGFGEKDADALRDAVRRYGVALIVLPDARGVRGYGDALGKAFGWKDPAPVALRFAPPVADLHVPPLALRPKWLDALAAWRRLAPPERLAGVPAQQVTLLKAAGGTPLLTYGLYGKGRCVLVGLADVWRMRLYDGWRDTGPFAQQLVALALTDPFEGGRRIGLMPALPIVDRPAWLFWRGDEDKPRPVKAFWSMGAAVGAIELQPSAGGTLSGATRFPTALPASLSIPLKDATVTQTVQVRQTLNDENIYFSTNEPLLKSLARRTNGQFARLTELEKLAHAVKPREQVEVRVHEYTLWHYWLILILIVAVATTEYLVRRKAGMVL